MIPDTYHDFFLAEAGASAALVGLLFVAISVAPERINGPHARIVEQARASSALTCFLLPLALALVALLPDSHIGIPAVIVSAAGLLFVAATIRRFFSVARERREDARGLLGLIGFTIVLAVVLYYGIVSLVDPASAAPVSAIAGATIASVLLGVERAWSLIGGRSTGRSSSLKDLLKGETRSDDDGQAR